ncbi:MAG: hypothetical protein HY695_30680 [Deltaproteobacteria bacterium]|nr:hypothetical protein [Deltaproteobacteria bacterium]
MKKEETPTRPRFKAALERAEKFEAELEAADPAMSAQLLGAYKELLMEEFVSVLKETSRPDRLALLDQNIALVQELNSIPKETTKRDPN